ncbi:hypothetical protein VTK56DRAFT_9367 [Thermocarpiscus australiensis]
MVLVQYDSSDEDEDVQTQQESRSANPPVEPFASAIQNAPESVPSTSSATTGRHQNTTQPPTEPPTQAPGELGPVLGPALGPPRPPQQQSDFDPHLPEVDLSFLDSPSHNHNHDHNQPTQPDDPPRSPYTATRTLLRDLTLPAVPNMDIPASPPGTPPPGLDALTAKFDNLLRLKRTGGVHFNERLASSAGLRNPALMDKLLAFVGIETEFGGGGGSGEDGAGGDRDGNSNSNSNAAATEQYGTVLSAEVWDPHGFPAWAYRGALRKAQERGARERERGRGEPVEFVAAAAATTAGGGSVSSGIGSAAGSRSGTPGVGAGRRKGRFDT